MDFNRFQNLRTNDRRALRTGGYFRYLGACVTALGLAFFLSGCGGGSGSSSAPVNVLYVTSNDPASGRNAVLGYRRASDGSLSPLTGSPYLMGGTGVTNNAQIDGPDDDDQELIVSSDHKYLYAVNGGSNTIAGFKISSDGSLAAIAGSPYASGGVQPASLALVGDKLYAVNKNQDPGQAQTATGANYAVFQVASDGSLASIAGSTVSASQDSSPSQALISRNQKLLIDAEENASVLRSFRIGANGLLTEASGSPLTLPLVGGVQANPLGLATHPSQNLLYVGFVNVNRLGVYSFDDISGSMTAVGNFSNSGSEPCWLLPSSDGRNLYTANFGDASLSRYDLSSPSAPVEKQHIVVPDASSGGTFQLSLDPSGKLLYVVQQRVTKNAADLKGNAIHVYQVAADGSLSAAPLASTALPVPSNAHPQGIAVF